jgi:hypothetical protein
MTYTLDTHGWTTHRTGQHMNRDEEYKVLKHFDLASEKAIERAENLIRESSPGQWVVRNGSVTRYSSDEPLTSDSDLGLMAESRAMIPVLIRGIRALEDSVRSRWESEQRLESELRTERNRTESLARSNAGRVAAGTDILENLLDAHAMGTLGRSAVRGYIERWAGGDDSVRQPDWVTSPRRGSNQPDPVQITVTGGHDYRDRNYLTSFLDHALQSYDVRVTVSNPNYHETRQGTATTEEVVSAVKRSGVVITIRDCDGSITD